jgi:hypothetical protein
LEKLEQVLNRLSQAGLKINAVKSCFGRTTLEYLGYNITREGIRPSQKKVDAILLMKYPKSQWISEGLRRRYALRRASLPYGQGQGKRRQID